MTDGLLSILHIDEVIVGDLLLCEVLQGLESEQAARDVGALLRRFEIVSMAGDAIAVAGARNFRFLRRRGITVRKTIDHLIGTWCIENRASLIYNDSDFHPMTRYLGLRGRFEIVCQACSSSSSAFASFRSSGVESLAEPAVDWRQQIAGFDAPALFAPQSGETRGRSATRAISPVEPGRCGSLAETRSGPHRDCSALSNTKPLTRWSSACQTRSPVASIRSNPSASFTSASS